MGVYYEMMFNADVFEESFSHGKGMISATEDNLDDFSTEKYKKGFYRHILKDGVEIKEWPSVKFFYDSEKGDVEADYLRNTVNWLVVHKRVQKAFEKENISGLQYLPVKVIDVVTKEENRDYVAVNILNVIEAYDMIKSEYEYKEKYNIYSFLPHTTYLDLKVVKKYDIFRATKFRPSIYVSQKIKDLIDENQWTGFDFIRQKTNQLD